MKKTVLTAVAILVSAAAQAGIVEQTKSKPELAGTLEVASLAEWTSKVSMLGQTISNPIVPMLALSSGQQAVEKAYGKLRADSPVWMGCYVYMPAFQIAGTNDDMVAMSDIMETVVLYPSAEKPATMLLNHPGAKKDAEGTIHLLPGEGHPDDRYAAFTSDGMYCAFSSKPELARKAAADFQKGGVAWQSSKDGALLRLRVFESGIDAIWSVCEEMSKTMAAAQTDGGGPLAGLKAIQDASRNRQMKALKAMAGFTAALRFGKKGIDIAMEMKRKPGAEKMEAAGFRLPAGALDNVPGSAPIFGVGNVRLSCGYADEKAFREDVEEMRKCVAGAIAAAKADKDKKRFAPLLDGLAKTLDEMFGKVPYPAVGDWTAGALAFGARREPYLVFAKDAEKAAEIEALNEAAAAGVAAALEAQWPGCGMLTKTGAGKWRLDWNKVLETAAAESGAKDARKEIEKAKRTLAGVLGGTAWEISDKRAATKMLSVVKPEGLKEDATAGQAEKRLAAALPEVSADRPSWALMLSIYSLLRDNVMPIAVSVMDEKDTAQWNAVLQSMAPAEPNSAAAAAMWTDADGSCRILFRVTTGELKNFGAAFNAFTAATMSSAAGR